MIAQLEKEYLTKCHSMCYNVFGGDRNPNNKEDMVMTEDRILALVIEVANDHNCTVDGFAEDIAEAIIEDNGLDLNDADVKELAEQFFEADELFEEEDN